MATRRDVIVGGSALAAVGLPDRAVAAAGHYTGQLILGPGTEERAMQLVRPFGYVDSAGRPWRVPAGAWVDGASIPPLFWPLIGGPFEGRYRAASVIHDWWCFVRARTWEATHRMFLDAMTASQVEPGKAKLMYLAVWWKGPRWDELTRRNMDALTRGGTLAPPAPPPPSPPPPPPPPPPAPPPPYPEPPRPTAAQAVDPADPVAQAHAQWQQNEAANAAWRTMQEGEARRAAAARAAWEADERAQRAAEAAQRQQFQALAAQVERDQLSPGQIEALAERAGPPRVETY